MKTIGRIAVLLFAFATLAGAQQQKFMMAFLSIDPNRPYVPETVVDSLQKLHRANMGVLANQRKLLAAGPFDGGGGIFVFATGSLDTAMAWLSTDPAVRSKRWKIEMLPYSPHVGSICNVGEKYTMTNYAFIRYTWDKGDSLGHFTTLVQADSLIAAGILEGSGGIIVARGSVDEAALKNDRVVIDGKVGVSVRRLFIARGSFCEDR